jgi:hypothetical protein
MIGIEPQDSVPFKYYQILALPESRVKRPPLRRQKNQGAPIIAAMAPQAPVASTARFGAGVSNISPKDRSYPPFLLLDPAQKGVDGLRWIGY